MSKDRDEAEVMTVQGLVELYRKVKRKYGRLTGNEVWDIINTKIDDARLEAHRI